MSEMTMCHRFQEVLAYDQGFPIDDEDAETEVHLHCCRDCQRQLECVNSWMPEMHPVMELSMLERQPARDVRAAIMRSLQ
jgi:hypothetical protein